MAKTESTPPPNGITSDQLNAITQWYGEKFADEANRVKSYDLLKTIVEATPLTNTEAGLRLINAEFKNLSDQEFAFLVAHSGFIPDHYGDDSSEETLYSKLIEAVVGEWGTRLGFDVVLQRAKSSTEDVTFTMGTEVLVLDAKSFRLGRSQGAPNTKDVIKPEDYAGWLDRHTGKTAVGGLVAFPSRFDWKTSSDVYRYASNAKEGKRILLLFYEHMAYMLLKKSTLAPDSVFCILREYDKHFNAPSNDKDSYWFAINKAVEGVAASNDLKDFLPATRAIIGECVRKTIERIEGRIAQVERDERTRIEAMDEALLREALIASEVERKTGQYKRRLNNIRKFRL
jgi:hypothetical protein